MKRSKRRKPDVEIEFVHRKEESAEQILDRIERMKKDHPDLKIRAAIRDVLL